MSEWLGSGIVKSARTITAFGKTKSLSEWAAETGIEYHTLYHRVVRGNWEPERAVTIRNGRTIRIRSMVHRQRKVRRMLEQKMSRWEIAERLDCSLCTVKRDVWALDLGIDKMIEERQRQVHRMLETMSVDEIADELDVSPRTVRRDIRAILKDSSIARPQPVGTCDCGQPATHVEEVRLRTRTFEKMPLCESCYELFLEVENR